MSKKKPQTTQQTIEQEKPKTKYDRKMEARRKEAARQKREAITFRIICIVVLVGIIGTAGYFGVTQFMDVRTATAKTYVKVGDHELTQLEYDYHFNTTVNNYINTYSSILSYIGLDTTKPLEEQNYSEDMTWQEYFEQTTLEQVKQTYALLDDARANNFEYDTTEDYEGFVTQAKETAKTNKITMWTYYKSMFGEYATANNMKPFLESTYLANAYYNKLLEDNTPSEDTATDYYEEHKADYDKVSYYSFTFDPANYKEDDAESGETPSSQDDTDTPSDQEDTNEEDAKKTAHTLAEEMKERLEDGKDFETLCAEYAVGDAKANYESTDKEYSLTENVVCSSVNQTFRQWVSNESRKAGDITMVQDTDTGICYVLKFVARTYDENCLDSISSKLASDAVTEYLDGLLKDKYEISDVMGKISYLNKENNENSTENDEGASSSDTEAE